MCQCECLEAPCDTDIVKLQYVRKNKLRIPACPISRVYFIRSVSVCLTMRGEDRSMLMTVRLTLRRSRSIISWTCPLVGPCGDNATISVRVSYTDTDDYMMKTALSSCLLSMCVKATVRLIRLNQRPCRKAIMFTPFQNAHTGKSAVCVCVHAFVFSMQLVI